MNLADDESTVKSYEGYDASYYATTNYIALNMGVDFTAEEFRAKLAEGLRFFAANPGVYAVHCTEGKDRAGFVSALLEIFMGARYDEVVGDYMTTFYNYYGVTPADERYENIANSNIVKTLSRAFGVENLKTADLKMCAEQYIKSIGLSDTEISALRDNLAAEHNRDTSFFAPHKHTDLRYDEIEYEHIDPAPLLKEAETLRTLCRDAQNEKEFERRFLALADEYERMSAMAAILMNRTFADVLDEWAASEYQKVNEETETVSDAFRSLVCDALDSPCSGVLTSRMSARVADVYRNYREVTDEEKTLRMQETKLINAYQVKSAELVSVTMDGKTWTDESLRNAYINNELSDDKTYEISLEITKAKNAALGSIFIELVDVRNRIAKLNGCATYADYAYQEIFKRDDMLQKVQVYCDAVRQYLIPADNAYALLRKPVDASELPEGIAYSGDGMFQTLFPYFGEISDELLESVRYMYEHKAYNIDSAPNKSSVKYSTKIPYYEMPYYFGDTEGTYVDLVNAIHEMDHANTFYWQDNKWNTPKYKHDVAEACALTLELLMLRYYGELFGAQADAVESAVFSDDVLGVIVRSCITDEWQRRVYETPDLTLEKLNRLYREVCGEYGGVEADDPRTEMYAWCLIPEIFLEPMNAISHLTAAVGAMAFWERGLSDWHAAVDDYLRFAAQSAGMDLAEAFEQIGIADPMSEAYIKDLAQTIHDKLLPVKPYDDVWADDWYGEYVLWVSENHLMNGVDTDRFAPNDAATREQSMTILARAVDHGEHNFTLDDGVAWAVEGGVSDGQNRTDTLTREQFVTMLWRMMTLRGHDVSLEENVSLSGYRDAANVSAWAADAMRWAVGNGIANGMGDESLAPQGRVSRAQMAAMLYRCVATLTPRT